MVIDFGQKAIEVSCKSCDWSEVWIVASGIASRTVSGKSDAEQNDEIISNETNILGMSRIPKRCPKCGDKTKRSKLPIIF